MRATLIGAVAHMPGRRCRTAILGRTALRSSNRHTVEDKVMLCARAESANRS
jgi:hypothetical protein